MTKFCKDCKSCERSKNGSVYQGAACYSDQRPLDYVTGDPIYGNTSMFRGAYLLPNDLIGRDLCGPEAKWFEPFAQPTNE